MALSPERFAVAAALAGTAALPAYVGLRGVGLGGWVAGPMALVAAGLAASRIAPRLPQALDDLRRRRPWLCLGWLLLALFAIVQTARLSIFVLDPARAQHSMRPSSAFTVSHSCLTAYQEAARLSREGHPNLYQPDLYLKDAGGQRRKLDSFRVDLYHYPPPFLLLPRALSAVTGHSFATARTLWFSASALLLIASLVLLARRFEPEAQLRTIGMAPAVWASTPMLIGLQLGNVQHVILALSLLALVAFPRRAPVGGALLAFAAVSKIFPGILVLYLAVRRRWRDLAWTAGFAVVLCAAAWLLLGPAPFRAFVELELPRLSTGAAFAGPFSRPEAVAGNLAPFGIALKLKGLGVPGMSMAVGRVISTLFGLLVLALVVRAARAPFRSHAEQAAIWIAALALDSLVAPFAPLAYAGLAVLVLIAIDRTVLPPAAALAAFLAIWLPSFFAEQAQFSLARVLMFLPAQVVAVVVPVVVLYRAGSSARTGSIARPATPGRR